MDITESRGLALGRGFIVLIMPAVHTVLIYGNDTVKAGLLGTILGFLAEQPGAQLFMLQMGLFIGIGRPKTTAQTIKRFLVLLIAGYLLNFLRLALPYCWGGLPEAFLAYNKIPGNGYTALYLLATGDILQFAALGYLFCQVVQHAFKNIYLKILLFFALLIVSPLTWTFESVNTVGAYMLGLFNGLPPAAFFPFFPWICYPVAGIIMAQVIKQHHQKIRLRFWIAIAVLLTIFGVITIMTEPTEWTTTFYRLGPGASLFHVGAAIAWIVLFVWLAKRVRANSFFDLLAWLSKHITIVYFLQWIIIIWLIPVFGFNKLGLDISLFAIAVNTLTCLSIAACLSALIKNWRHRFLKQ